MAATGRVYLVGAGPGDPELITARGLRRVREADLILYDALVHPDQLEAARPGCELVFVGKRAGRVSQRQAEINRKLVRAAREGKTVVRLKGGDPYLFGRGSEEAELLASEGIPFEVVPGVPSPLAATAYAGLSLTHRELSSSVAYVTATESVEKDRTGHDWSKLATATQTLVIFMGMRKLESLTKLLIDHGRPADTPAAVVQWASLPTQRTVVGTLANIHHLASEAEMGLPALTIIGDVVRLRENLRWFDTKPLFGKRVLVTRAVRQAGSLSGLLRDEGAQPILAPTIRIVPPADRGPMRRAVADLGRYDWVLLTSANAVDALFASMQEADLDARALGPAKICAIGSKTQAALRAHGVRADLLPDEARAEGVVAALRPQMSAGTRVLLPRAEVAREVLPESLRAAGAVVDVVVAYRNLPPEPRDIERIRSLVDPEEIDIVLFTSSSTVENLCDVLGDDGPARLNALDLFSIGPVTTRTAERLGLRVTATSADQSIESLVATARTYYAKSTNADD
ncbi:MAG TPA: uroporphyrinogen-III C-methyltransferase [Polyangiales bacterium]|nr:uroporphyrinogen-III C-methyltransferase [Polyangiales bacterium]